MAATSLMVHASTISAQPQINTREIRIITRDGLQFRDLDRDGQVTPYEDWRLAPERRAADLVARMSPEEKAGLIMHGNLPAIGAERGTSSLGYDLGPAKDLILEKHISSFITRLQMGPREVAEQNNAVQTIAERGRWGIPLTVSTDPRNHFVYVLGQSANAGGYSRWPETLGFAALRDPERMQRFADVARNEYRLTGIHQALSPQVDLFTDPRWARGYGTFGANPTLSRALSKAYVEGFQGGSAGLTPSGVLATVKHWVAYGATINGLDGHSYYGRYARVDARSFRQHIEPFLGAFDAHVGAVMPTYDIIQGAVVNGRPVEPVGAGFNRQLLTELLRGKYKFSGLIVSDWAITKDCTPACIAPTAEQPQRSADLAMPWGVEHLSRLQRFAKGVNAGIDQFGGVAEPELILQAVSEGLISQSRVDQSAMRVLAAKFALGLFEAPFVDPERADREINTPEVRKAALKAQAEAQVLLLNRSHALPISAGTRVFLHGVDPEAARRAGLVPVQQEGDAQIAIARVATPFEQLHPYHLIGSTQHEGRLDFRSGDADLELVRALSKRMPVVVALFVDRPVVLGEMNKLATALVVNFGIDDDALLASVTGRDPPCGRLPFELPSSMQAVNLQNPALPDDSDAPTYRAGAGIPMSATCN